MMKKGNILVSVIWGVAAVLIAGLLYVGFNQWLKNRAVETCYQVGKNVFENPESNSRAEIPDMVIYKQCMQEKGY